MKEIFKKYKNQIIVSVLTFFLFEVILIGSGILPFKVEKFLISDLYYEYIPFYNYFRDAFFNGRSILNSFSFTLGQSTVGILAYYALSPLNIFLLLSNSHNIAYFVKILMIVKIIFCGLSMSIYLKDKTSDLKNIMFSLIYALTSYNILYFFNVMWLDVIYILPLVILGLEKLIDGKGVKLYLICLTIMIFSNFYIAFGSCIFIFIYFFYYSFVNEKLTFKLFLKFALFSIIAGLLNAFMLLPTAYNMLLGKALTSTTYTRFILYNPKAVIYDFIPGIKLGNFLIDLPYFYVSTLVLLFFLIIPFSSKISFKEKVATIVFVIFMIMVTLIAPLDLLMHLFRTPNSFNYRYIFNLSFLLISFAAKKEFKFTYLAFIPVFIVIVWACTLYIDYRIIIFACLLIIYLFLIKYQKTKIIFIILMLELVYNGIIINQKVDPKQNYKLLNEYKDQIKDYLPKENDFYRIELSKPITLNDSFVMGTYGINSFSPTVLASSNNFLKGYLKFPSDLSYNLIYQKRTILDPYLLGIKYEINDGQVLENSYYLPILFKVNSLDDLVDTNYAIGNSNQLYHMINNEDFFEEVDAEIDCFKNGVINKKECNLNFDKDPKYKYYIEVFIPIGINGFIKNDYDYNFEHYVKLIDDDFKLEFEQENNCGASIKIYRFDESKIKSVSSDIEKFNDTYIKANVSNGYYLTTIPYDESWHIRNNGREIKLINFMNYLVAFEAEEGTVELEYVPRGINIGILISSLTFLTIFVYYERKKLRINN